MQKINYILVLLLLGIMSFTLEYSSENRPISNFCDGIATFFTPDEPVRILAVGDIMMGRYVRVLMNEKGPYYPFEKIFSDKEWLSRFDIVTGNLEGPITERFITGGTAMTFGFPPDTAQILKNVGFSAVGLANNHMHDRGAQGYEETKKYLSEVGVGYYGNYSDPATSPGYFTEIRGEKIAFLGFNDVFGILDLDSALELISKVKKDVDYVLVFPHWGREYEHLPSKRQVLMAEKFLEAGADAVIGHHPHVVQSYEVYDGEPVFYSLGNFVFDQYFRADVEEGLMVELILDDGEVDYEIYKIGSELSQPYVVE